MRYAFADCVLDTETFALTRDGVAVPVEPQVFDLLVLLAENAGKLVSRDRLVEVVWNGRIVSEATIAARINAARRAVGDDGKRQAVIRTVPRRGIELCAEVRIEEADAPVAATTGSQTIRYTTSADGTLIAYALSGDGPPLLRAGHHVSHLELDWNSRFWRPGFDLLGQSHRLVRYDIRRTGLSDGGGAADYITAHVQDLAAVADANGLDRFPIFANLNSAAVAIRFAAENPERVSRLVIQEGYARGRAMRDAEGEEWHDPFVSLLREGGWGDTNSGYMRAWLSIAVPGLRFDDATELIELIAGACSTENALASREVIDRYDVREYLGAVQAPTLVIHCRNNTLHPMAEGRLIAAGIPDAEFLVVESGNTLCLTPDPTWQQQFDAILGFLAKG